MILDTNDQVECTKCGKYFPSNLDDNIDRCTKRANSAFEISKSFRIVAIAMESTSKLNVES